MRAVHEALDPEYSILKQRLARRMRYEGIEEAGVQDLDLVAVTKVNPVLFMFPQGAILPSLKRACRAHHVMCKPAVARCA